MGFGWNFSHGDHRRRLTDDSGEPIGGAQVHLFRLDQYTGEAKIVGAGKIRPTTPEPTSLRASRPALTTFGVSASPWYAFHPAAKTDASGNPLPDDSSRTRPSTSLTR